MELYSAIDLHSNNSHVAIIDDQYKRVFYRKLANDAKLITNAFAPYQARLKGIVIESTFNWYWLADLLMEKGYSVHLANPCGIQKYSGLKHADDRHDAFWLAQMLALNILPEGYIYPKEERPLRDLLRKRAHLVRVRTSLILSLQNIVMRNHGVKIHSADLKKLTQDPVAELLKDQEELALAGSASKETIDFLTRQIQRIETAVRSKARLKEPFSKLLTLPGVGDILGMTILLETGPIERFKGVGHYASYCRKVSSRWTSNEKTKGKGNTKNGNRYLSWAFSEAADHARMTHELSRNFYNRKLNKTNASVAHNALAHKLARAAYFIMRDHVEFKEDKMFR
jgi:transposase